MKTACEEEMTMPTMQEIDDLHLEWQHGPISSEDFTRICLAARRGVEAEPLNEGRITVGGLNKLIERAEKAEADYKSLQAASAHELQGYTEAAKEVISLRTTLAEAVRREREALTEIDRAKAENDEISQLNHGQYLELEYLRRVEAAAHELHTQAEEYDFPDGLGQGASQDLWDALADALEPETEAIAEAIRARKGEHDEQH